MDVPVVGGQRAVGQAALLTAEQRAAIELRTASVSLSAGAGCGKTFVLTRRFLSHLEPEPGDEDPAQRVAERLSRLIAITFTERAAREMRDRIRSVCRQRLFERDPREAPHWLALLRALDSARISTIHAFCGSLLRTHAVEAGLDPHFVTLDESQAATLVGEIIDSVLRTRLAAQDERAVDLVQRFGLEPLKNLVHELWSERTKIDWPAWRSRSVQEVLTAWQDFRQGPGGRAALGKFATSHEASKLLRLLEEQQPNHPVMSTRWQTLRDVLPKLNEQEDLEAALTLVRENATVKGGGLAKAWDHDDIYQTVKETLKKFRDAVDKVRTRFAWDPEAAQQAAEQGLRVLAMAADVSQTYQQRKRELAALDFDDLILRARDLLAEPRHAELRRRLSERLDLLLVDEFQDTDTVQTDLVRLLCGEGLERGKLFFVGDVKQSIYRFRGADPRVFVDLTSAVPPEGRLPLSANFRSQPAILHFVNHLFSERLGRETPYQPLRAVRQQVTPEPAIELLWATADGSGPAAGAKRPGTESSVGNLAASWGGDLPSQDELDDDDEDVNAQLQAAGREGAPAQPDDDDDETVGELRRREARWVARRLRQLFDSREPLVHDAKAPGGARAARPGDAAILFKTLSDVQHYEAALRDEGIDYYLVGGHAFYAQQEIFDLANLLRTLARPADNVSLAGVLRSPFFSLADESLLWLTYQSGSLAQAMQSETTPVELDAEQTARVRFARQTLIELRALKDRLPLAELVERALTQTGYDAALVAEFMGARKLANLRKLVDLARSFDQSGIFTLDDFVTQLLEQVATLPKEAPAATEAENANVVRLMTIHQSKGLEFPLVVVPDINRQPRGPTEAIAFDPELGPLLRPADEAQRRGAGPGLELYRLRAAEDDLAEQIRLFYVATTRAADYLILSAGVNEAGAADSPWTKLLAERFDLVTGASRGTGAAEQTPQVRVTLAEPQVAAAERKPARHNLTDIVARARTTVGAVPRLAAPAPVDAQARRQFSVSRLRGTIEAVRSVQQGGPVVDDADATPLAAEQAATLGTLVHAALELIDFQRPDDLQTILERQAIELSQSKRAPLPGAAELADARKLVERFLKTPRAAALGGATQVLREVEFVLAWPPGRRVLPTSVTLRGFLDCLYQDVAGWHLIDYKTNQISAMQVAQVAAEYELQMLLYGLVVHEVTGQPPASLTLCFLRPGAEHTFRWDDAARQRAITMVDVALAKARGGDAPRRHAGKPTTRPGTAGILDAIESHPR